MSEMHLTAYYSLAGLMSYLLEAGLLAADVKDQAGRMPLIWAAYQGKEAVVKVLLRRRDADINCLKNNELGGYLWTALTYAIIRGHVGIVSYCWSERTSMLT